MAQTGYTPILIYASGTASNTPLAANLTSSASGAELAINYADGKLFYKDSGGVVQVLATKGTGPIGGSDTQIQYNSSGSLAGSANLTFNGTTLTANTLNLTNALGATYGGTGQSSYAVGDLLYASSTTALSKLADVATGNALISGGVSTAPSWGKIGLTTHVSGTLPTANGGTGLTSFTANGVVYASSSSALTTGSALVFDGTALSVGANGLYLSGNTGGAAYMSTYGASTATELIFGTSGNIPIRFIQNNSERMRLDTSGNLGLGVTPSASTDSGNLTIKNGSTLNWSAGSANITSNATFNSSWKYITTAPATRYRTDTGQHIWDNAPSGTAGNAITFTQAMTLDASGNLGVGTTSPIQKLHVAGKIAVSGTNPSIQQTVQNAYLDLCGGTTVGTDPSIQIAGSTTTSDANKVFYNSNTHVFRSSSGGTTYSTIDSSGNLLVNQTSGTSYKISVKTSSASQSAIGTAGTSGDTAYQAILITKFDNDSTTSQNFIQFQINNGGANCGKITANGANTAAFGSTSDQRVKQNIVDLPSQLANILALRPVEFDYVEAYGGGHQIGFIAQEMQQVYPDVISEENTEEKILSITGWSKTEARLVKAIQEQNQLIQQLTDRITALEAK